MLDKTLISNIEKVFFVDNDPFPNAIINNFLPIEVAKKAENEFLNYRKTVDAGNTRYQKTKMHNEDYKNMPDTIKKIIDLTPMRRMASAEEIANFALYIASENASYLSGDTIFVTGGR